MDTAITSIVDGVRAFQAAASQRRSLSNSLSSPLDAVVTAHFVHTEAELLQNGTPSAGQSAISPGVRETPGIPYSRVLGRMLPPSETLPLSKPLPCQGQLLQNLLGNLFCGL